MNRKFIIFSLRPTAGIAMLLLFLFHGRLDVQANPTGVIASWGATVPPNPGGPQLTITQTSPNAFINWQSFNIAPGETTTFVQPSSSSIILNQISDANPSQILGNLNANGYVFLQNQNGFYVGGQASITAHGLIMTTAAIPAPNLSSGGAWSFTAPPPSAQIINYGQIKTTGGGSVFLIASDIENRSGIDSQNNNSVGTISAPGGKIGLYAGEKVLVSMSPDGRGLSAEVTLPTGSVDNHGNLIADAGSIAAQAKFVNQSGLIQANSVQNVNGTIELVADDTLNLNANSTISAEGSSQATSAGGVTLQAGNTINNNGQVLADGSSITVTAPTVNQNGILQANSIGNVNGAVEIDASSSLALGASSQISANGDPNAATGSPSLGGFVILDAGRNTFSDQSGSTISVSGTQGGQNGFSEILGVGTTYGSIKSTIDGLSAAAFSPQQSPQLLTLFVNPYDIAFSSSATATSYDANNNLDANFNINSLSGSSSGVYSRIDLHALHYITIKSVWTLAENTGLASELTLTAGNSIILNTGTGLDASENFSGVNYSGNNWSVNLTAGTGFVPTTSQHKPVPDANGFADGIYLNGSSYLQTQTGDINLWAANEVQVGWSGAANLSGTPNTGTGRITTFNDGNINVTTLYGDVNSGSDASGFVFKSPSGIHHNILVPPYYGVFTTGPNILGGISTAAGGNVTINAGQDVISYLPTGTETDDAGTGAFGAQAGNVTINAGRNVYGHYVLANGVGTITAGNTVGISGAPNPQGVTGDQTAFALSLIAGTWNVNAPNGNIYLQEVRNPNGVFNTVGSTIAAHLFDYASDATVNLDAGIGVSLTDVSVPRPDANGSTTVVDAVPVIYPPILNITAGPGGVTLQGNVTLFPSADQNLTINTTGSMVSAPNNPGSTPELLMSDSSQKIWSSQVTTSSGTDGVFSDTDHGTGVPVQAGSAVSSVLNISGNMGNLILFTTRQTQITVGGDMIDCGFSGQNLSAGDATSITVGGEIYNRSPYSFAYDVNIPNIPTADLLPGMGSSWNDIFTLALDMTALDKLTVPATVSSSQLTDYIIENTSLKPFNTHALSNGQLLGSNPGFVYNSTTYRLGFAGQMPSTVLTDLTQPISVLHLVNGLPVIDPATGHYETDTINWVNPLTIAALAQASTSPSALEALVGLQTAAAPSQLSGQLGYRLGGPGQFDINANSISLGNTYGILSCGVSDPQGGYGRYNNLASMTPAGASVNVTVADDQTTTVNGVPTTTSSLDMLTSTIAAIGGGDVNVTSTGGSMDLGSQELFNTPRQVSFGVFTSGNGNVNVTALGDVNIDGSKIAAFDGGNVSVESQQGTVNVGSGAETPNGVVVTYVNSAGQAAYYAEQPYGSGIDAFTLINPSAVPGSPNVPGNITVNTPQGDIVSTLGGILQLALNGNIAGGPTVTLTAGTFPPGNPNNPDNLPEHTGNINLGQSGVIGGTVNLSANGNISGVVISRENSSVNAAQNFNGTLLSAGAADVSAGGTVAGTVVGIGGANVSGGTVSAAVLGQNVSVNGGAATSTLGSSANATSTSQSASQQASQSADQQVASADNGNDDQNKKKKPVVQKTSRVTVLLSAATPER
jgi:filamentous hemagglutinin family protein